MVSNRMTEGVGKKIVEALKKQTDVEFSSINNKPAAAESVAFNEPIAELEFINDESFEEIPAEEKEPAMEQFVMPEPAQPEMNLHFDIPQIEKPVQKTPPVNNTMSFSQVSMNTPEAYVNEFEDDELPQNVNVLRQLISKLPNNVSKQTGAQIIKQTMEALGVPMKTVLQEAQQVQENLNTNARNCQNQVIEIKHQIGLLEKQSQKYQRQYAQLNDIISLFIQTGN